MFWMPESEKRPVQSSTLAKALALNMDGKTEQALREIRQAIDGGEKLPELAWTKAHLEFQLGHFENALEDYQKVLRNAAKPQGRNLQRGPLPREVEALRRGQPRRSAKRPNWIRNSPRRFWAWASLSCIATGPKMRWRPLKNA